MLGMVLPLFFIELTYLSCSKKICISPFEKQSVACRSKSCAISTFAYLCKRGASWAVYPFAYAHRANVKPSEGSKETGGQVASDPPFVVEIFCRRWLWHAPASPG
jgi:hypothetical protein